ncbi:MAG TPA: anti-sigma factor [Methylocella sp.]|nr:anti-sigma factor [Methylocella sp.]
MTALTRDELLLLNAALDGELDAAAMLSFEKRLAETSDFAAEYNRLKTLQGAIRREFIPRVAPADLRARVMAMAAPAVSPRRATLAPNWQALAASVIIAAGLGSLSTWLVVKTSSPDIPFAELLIDDHKRGLLSGQPFDVASADRHKIKPWFASRFALAPKVEDLEAQGFPLAGGRIDVVAGTPAPVLLYRHNEHYISLTALPARGNGAASFPSRVDGYAVETWREGNTDYWAISDADPATLIKFRQAFEGRS